MKSLLTIAILFCASLPSFAQEHDEVAWFDMANCEICKTMAGIEGMMEHVKWEIHPIENGFLSVTVMPDEMKEHWAAAMNDMKSVVAKVEKGEDVKLCGFCKSMGDLIQAGAKKTELETVAGHIEMMTSDDPKVVEKLHAHAKRTIEAHKKMMEMMKEHSHDGHHEHGNHDDHDHDHDDHDHDGR